MYINRETKTTTVHDMHVELSQKEFDALCDVFNCFFSSRILATEDIYTSYMTDLGAPNKEIEKSWNIAKKFCEELVLDNLI